MSHFTADPTRFNLPEIGRILCCLCGTSILPNEAAMCNTCLKLQYQSEIPKSYEIELVQCSKCNRWHHRQSQWVSHEPESPELLTFCMKKIPFFMNNNNASIKVVDSNWIWTEPHSRRLKLYVNYEHKLADYQSLAITNQIQAEYIIKTKQCITCIYENNDHKWNAMIQLRAFTASSSVSSNISSNTLGIAVLNANVMSKVFYQIETLLIQSKLYEIIQDIETVNLSTHRTASSEHHSGQHKPQANAVTNGLNLYFYQKNQAEKVLSFLSAYFPFITKTSKKMISSDQKNHTTRTEHIILMELLPVNRNDILIVPKQLHGKAELMLVTKLSSLIHGINPLTLQSYEISVMKYCQYPFQTILNEKYLLPFVVLDVTPIYSGEEGGGLGGSILSEATTASQKGGAGKKKHQKAKKVNKSEVWLAGDKKKGTATTISLTSPETSTAKPVETDDDLRSEVVSIAPTTGQNQKWQLAEVVVAKESDLGENDITYTVRTHLGNVLQAGDTVLGYDLVHTVFGCQQEFSLSKMKGSDVPEVILVKKVYPEKEGKLRRKRKNRIPPWRRAAAAAAAAAGEGGGGDVGVQSEDGEEEEVEETGEPGEEIDEEFEELLDQLEEVPLETIAEEDEDEEEEEGEGADTPKEGDE